MKTIRFSRYTDEMLDDIAYKISQAHRKITELFIELSEQRARLDKIENKGKQK